MADTDFPGGIYIHVPFCLSKCRYCDFYSVPLQDGLPDYVSALHQEINLAYDSADSDFRSADTLYFGGGTPSLLPPRSLASLLDRVISIWDMAAHAEITLEANPATVGPPYFAALRDMGINRLNIGVQSFSQKNLSFLGRVHTAPQARKTVEYARRAGFENLGLDMIYGLPGQSLSQWATDLRQGIELNPNHLSCYILSFEPGTGLHADLQSGRIHRPDSAVVADQFRMTHDMLADAGYQHYEISNFARPGYISRHNSKYWNHAPYLGLGPAAHSYIRPRRWWNHRSLDRYMQLIGQGQRPIEDQERLDATQQLLEALYLGLRQGRGIDIIGLASEFPDKFCVNFQGCLQLQCRKGLMTEKDNRYRLTVEGMIVLDNIVAQLVDELI